jgi:FAD/FMN-containing dehydrogenase
MMTESLRVWPLALCCAWLCTSGCAPERISNDPNAHVPLASAPEWGNWAGDLVYQPISGGEDYYFSPTTREELQTILAKRPPGMSVRVSGQRHSQPPLVLADTRGAPPEAATTWIIDLSCYHDLGTNGAEVFQLDAANGKLTVNAGVREDHIDAFLTANDLMLQTVTAGGFFSVGGMTAVDVHGATIAAPIFAETASAFTIMAADGSVTTIDETTPAVDGWSPLQFARVSLGTLGIVTSVTLDVLPRPYATTLVGGQVKFEAATEAAFVERYTQLLAEHDRLESFWNPYSNHFRVLWWDTVATPKRKTKNEVREVASSCTFAELDKFGAPYEAPDLEKAAEALEHHEQLHGSDEGAKLLIDFAMDVIEVQAHEGNKRHSDMWLLDAAQVIFMSYFVELPNTDAEGLHRVWQGLEAVKQANSNGFRVAGPLEFRFIRGGDSVMAGTYSTTADALFVNIDLIGFIESMPTSDYPPAMLEFFATVEREWVALGGLPHNGKMYGFYDPTAPADTSTVPFNPAFLGALTERRSERVGAFEAYRRARDPEGVFCNAYLGSLGLCAAAPPEVAPPEVAPAEAAPAEAAPAEAAPI